MRQALEVQKAATEEMRGQLTAVKQEIVKIDSLRDVLDTQRSSLATQEAAAGASHAQLRTTVDDVHARVAKLEAAAVPAKAESTAKQAAGGVSWQELQGAVGGVEGTVAAVTERVTALEAAPAAWWASRDAAAAEMKDVRGALEAGQADSSARCERETRPRESEQREGGGGGGGSWTIRWAYSG